MNMRFSRRNGALLQTLVISIVLAMMASMIMKWVLGRYLLSMKEYNSSVATVRAQGILNYESSNWADTAVGNTSVGVDGKTATVTVSGALVTIDINED